MKRIRMGIRFSLRFPQVPMRAAGAHANSRECPGTQRSCRGRSRELPLTTKAHATHTSARGYVCERPRVAAPHASAQVNARGRPRELPRASTLTPADALAKAHANAREQPRVSGCLGHSHSSLCTYIPKAAPLDQQTATPH